MRYIPYSIFVLITMGILLGISMPGSSNDKMIEAAKALDQRFISAYNSRDVDKLMDCYWNNPALVNFSPGSMEKKGWEAVKADFTNFFNSVEGLKAEILEANYMVAGDVVIGWGKWRMTLSAENGEKVEILGRYTDVKAERDGKWVYILDHASVPLPPPAAASEN